MIKKIIASTCLFILIFAILLIYLITGKPNITTANICPVLCPVENSNTENDNNCNSNPDGISWTLPASTEQGYPLIDKITNDLSVYNFTTKSTTNTAQKAAWGQGALYLGSNEALHSPNYLYTAYIDKNTNTLKILSISSLTAVEVPNLNNVMYINSWTADSSAVYVYVSIETIKNEDIGMLPATGSIVFDKDRSIAGFYKFNINTGELTHVYPIDNAIITPMDNQKILTNRGIPNKLVSFNTQSFSADYDVISEEFDDFKYGQYSFNSTGTQWAFIHGDTTVAPTISELIFANFPNKAGTIVDTGLYADVQWPKFSLNNDFIAYQKRNGLYAPGIPKSFTWVYTKATNTKEKITEGDFIDWFNNDHVIVLRRIAPYGANDISIIKVNINTKTEEIIL